MTRSEHDIEGSLFLLSAADPYRFIAILHGLVASV